MTIIHTRQHDDTTVDVIRWLNYLGKDFVRINEISDLMTIQHIASKSQTMSFYFNGLGIIRNRIQSTDNELRVQLEKSLDADFETFFTFLYRKLNMTIGFGNFPYPNNVVNKLYTLDQAQQIGFKVPNYEIITSRNRIIKLKKKWGRIICKAINDGIQINTNSIFVQPQKTEEVTQQIIEKLEDNFAPTFVQKFIEKQFEVRVFYFKAIVLSIAIFTASSCISEVDGRIFDSKNPQRRVPFELPPEMICKVQNIMDSLKLNYGSLDLIVSTQNEYYFLEVNPFGQYGFVSLAGNFHIEKLIAKML